MRRFALALLIVATALGVQPVAAQKADNGNSEARMVVTVEAQHGKDVPALSRQDVVVRDGDTRDTVTGWVPLKGAAGSLDLFILLDDGSDTFVALQFNDLRQFINAQPPSTRIGVGYMRNGTVDIVQNLTEDHAAAAKSLRLPMGTPGNNPYFSLMDLMKRLPAGRARREILLVSNGIDPGEGLTDPYLDQTIEQAQKSRILIYAIYASEAGHYGHRIREISLGQNMLSRLAGETGAEAYFEGFHTPISFAPYLDQISAQLAHQYLLTFSAKAEGKDTLRHVDLQTEVPNAELVTADQAFIPAAGPR